MLAVSVPTYFPPCVHVAQTLSLILYRPPLEQLLEEGWLRPVIHRLHICSDWVLFCFDKLLRQPVKRIHQVASSKQQSCNNTFLYRENTECEYSTQEQSNTSYGYVWRSDIESLTKALVMAACLSALFAFFPFHTKIFIPPWSRK